MITTLLSMDRKRRHNLVAAIGCVTVFDVALGLSYPLLTLILEQRGVDAWLIGLNAGFGALGVVAAGPLNPVLTARFGSKRVARVCAVVVALVFIGFKLFDDLALWFPLRFILGGAAGMLFALSESWVVRSAEGPYRGRITAIYATILSAGFAVGPAIIPFTGFEGWTPFVIGCVIMLSTLVPLSFVDVEDRAAQETRTVSFFAFLPQAPILLTAVGMFALLDAAGLSLLPVYGLREGLDVETATLALTVLIAGNILLQYPIGWLSDRLPRRGVMWGCVALTSAAAFLLPLTVGTVAMWPVLVVLGACGFGIYTLAIAILGDRFKGSALVAGASAFAAMWGVGGVVGPPVAGLAMEEFGPSGLPVMLGIVFAAFALAMAARDLLARRRG